jgi:hypothetical protein
LVSIFFTATLRERRGNLASIKKIEVKEFQQKLTDEGVAFFGVVVMDEERIGVFQNKGDGELTKVKINEKEKEDEFKKRVKEFYEENPAIFTSETYFLVEELTTLQETEDIFRLKVGAGESLLQTFFHERTTPLHEIERRKMAPKYFIVRNEEEKEEILKKEEKEWKRYNVYSSLDDFSL